MTDQGGSNLPDGGGSTYPISSDPVLPPRIGSGSTRDGARERARNQIFSIWSDRLQLISVLSTFSTSIDSLLFSQSTNRDDHSSTGQLMLASFAGALIFHAAGAILAFLGAFVLTRYKFEEAQAHLPTGIQTAPPTLKSPAQARVQNDGQGSRAPHVGRRHEKHHSIEYERPSVSTNAPLLGSSVPPTPIEPPLVHATTLLDHLFHTPVSLSPEITIELVHPFRPPRRTRDRGLEGDDPKHSMELDREMLERLLLRCHRACSLFVLLGFTLLITGVVSYGWKVLDRSVAIFVSASVAFSLVVALFVLS
ncbi:hypothetical protein K488DRAFT_82409 [Vararia minispora EC-137]|uniref:Uncharacterized protein n=1 Tax=Vararia minispora EC-137 TaxID=1314806 RepID=A0ACB8QWA6_9AGAM|nr:hypothetical protein K488DRAFT_82409 [Vararia minispora EC-137]